MPNGSDFYQLLYEEEIDPKSFFQQLLSYSDPADYFLKSTDPWRTLQSLSKDLVQMEAAGGLVSNAKGEYLFIFRRGKWDLPKGKIDAGENPPEAALREVEEECGIRPDEAGPLLAETFHIYKMGEGMVLKKTYWYAMKFKGTQEPVPQLEEDITQAVWLNKTGLAKLRANTYPLILELMEVSGL